MGLLAGVTLAMGQLVASKEVSQVPPFQIRVAEPAPPLPASAPGQAYRVEVTDLTDARVVTSVLVDPVQWVPSEQRTFLLKLATQADLRARRTERAFELHAYSEDGPTQVQAQVFLRDVLKRGGLTFEKADWGLDGNVAQAARPAGLRLAADPLDAMGADPCFVQTGDTLACMAADAAPAVVTAGPSNGVTLSQAMAAHAPGIADTVAPKSARRPSLGR
jgi:hypothetical protein